MRDIRPKTARPRAWRLALFLCAAALPGTAMAQYIGDAPPPPAAPGAGVVETPSAALARNLRLIAQNPRNFEALVAAGRAALGLGDFQAAVGFFGRAEEVNPNHPAPKIGMGAASVQMGDNAAALNFFGQAQRLGASTAAIGADRGLAHDLNGNQATPQADYRAALSGPDRDEARRRLALSLGISGDRTSAFATLQPLLMRRDPAAARVRAFVLALLGDRAGARSAIDAAMPGSAARIDPFFAILPNLSPEQKAAAVHLGVFPTASEVKLAAAEPVRTVPQPQATVARSQPVATPAKSSRRSPKPTKVTVGRRVALAPQPIARAPAPVQVAAQPVVEQLVPAPADEPAPTELAAVEPPATGFVLPSSTLASISDEPAAPTAEPQADTQEPVTLAAGDRLSGIDRLLAEVSEAAPPAPQPRAERSSASNDKAARDRKTATAKKAADARKAADEKKEREALGVAGTHWVQLAGGSHADRMGGEFRKLAAKSSALKKRGGHVTQGKDYFRLLVGPFDSKGEGQSFVNTLAKDGVDGFSWTRTPATIKIEKLPPK